MTALAYDPGTPAPITQTPRRPRLAPVAADAGVSCVDRPLGDLMREEERLAYQAYLGDLHPTQAARLHAVSREIDCRWAVALQS